MSVPNVDLNIQPLGMAQIIDKLMTEGIPHHFVASPATTNGRVSLTLVTDGPAAFTMEITLYSDGTFLTEMGVPLLHQPEPK